MDMATVSKGGDTWTVDKYFAKRYDTTTAVVPPTHGELADMRSPYALKGVVIAGMKCLPLNTSAPGPAEPTNDDDIIDEALALLRTDTHHRKWAVDAPSECTLVYITRFVGECLRALEGCPNAAEGRQQLATMALAVASLPGERGFPLDGLLETANSRSEADMLRGWLQQCRSTASLRLLGMYYTTKGSVSPLWRDVARKSRKFFCIFGTYAQPIEEEAPYKRNTTSSRSVEVQQTPEQQNQELQAAAAPAADGQM